MTGRICHCTQMHEEKKTNDKKKKDPKERCEKEEEEEEEEGYKRIEFDVNAIICHEWIKLDTTVHCTEDQLSHW